MPAQKTLMLNLGGRLPERTLKIKFGRLKGICYVKNLARIKSDFGAALIKLGAKLYFDSDNSKLENLKDAINTQTTIGSYTDSGDHLRSSIQPMCEYDTQSVICALKFGGFTEAPDVKFSERVEYYKDQWK